jgi:hypothetical protein
MLHGGRALRTGYTEGVGVFRNSWAHRELAIGVFCAYASPDGRTLLEGKVCSSW